ncbi:zinc-binding alcohol dehydrogenase [uncultured Ruegeria sp.]|uniref:zinc-dependent alcohol dehydrogenase n=1 Tax=uncultured Ruegeria sp. TaxID=259304 RepID=UPI002621BA15|nr:zinc-binding alcohol dehydrogenase [uncultured Ruegeria sp.]
MTDLNIAQALWITGPETIDCRPASVAAEADLVVVDTLFSGISRGTERLVFQGKVPLTEHETMRAPFQEGEFSFPVKYGYSAVGRIASAQRSGETVFALYPHQTRFAVPATALTIVPKNVPPQRAVLAANMETALTISWDANISIGDRVVVIGAGVLGMLVAYLAARIAGTEVTLVDTNPARKELAEQFGCSFANPDKTLPDADLVIHTSANPAGLKTAIDVAGIEATIVEASWYGTRDVCAPLGGRFHQRRLRLVSSQVGRIPARQAARWTYGRRLELAMALLVDPALDMLISGESAFETLVADYPGILMDSDTLCHRVRYA